MLQGGQISKHHDVSSDGVNWSSIKTHPDFAVLFTPKQEQRPVESEWYPNSFQEPPDSASTASKPEGLKLKSRAQSQSSTVETMTRDEFPSADARSADSADESNRWYYERDGQVLGTITDSELPGLIMSGAIDDDTLVCRQGTQTWLPAHAAFPTQFARPTVPKTYNLHSSHDKAAGSMPSGLGWCLEAWRKYAVFTGRSTRREYWAFSLIHFLISFLLVIVEAATESSGSVLLLIYQLIAFMPALAVLARRLHDVNYSGWFMLISFLPIIGIIILLVLSLKAGDSEQNDYGPNPRGRQIYK
jgi:uncharacterized membrane protein YhaH (DUF805 family)